MNRTNRMTADDRTMKYAYYPGCSAESTARDLHRSTLAVADALGMELVEIPGWTCCGATAAHQTDRTLAAALPAVNLLKARDMGMDVMVNCAACYNRLKSANHEIAGDADLRERVADAVGAPYDGAVRVRHFIEALMEDAGLELLKSRLKRTLAGLPVACYYGCLLVRPPEVTQFDDPENPTAMDEIVTALGGTALDWPHKVECCGGGLALTRTDVVVRLADSIAGMAKAAGAACIAVACPMCQINLDMRQADVYREYGRRHDMPVLYLTQLIGLCMDLPYSGLGLEKLMVAPDGILDAVGYAGRKR